MFAFVRILYFSLLVFTSLVGGAVASELGADAQGGERQTTGTVFMVSPDDFGFNQETAASNVFQNAPGNPEVVKQRAMAEFSGMVEQLRASGIQVITLPSRSDVKTPDAVFPNNWFSLHKSVSGERVLVGYPMLAPNRRAERRLGELAEKLNASAMPVSRTVDLIQYEAQGIFLEGTGSLVLDRVYRIAYAALSPRTDKKVLADFSEKLGYRPVPFSSFDASGKLIYHTNVMMSVGDRFAVICAEAINDGKERAAVLKALEDSGKTVITITQAQVRAMCGNILQLEAQGRKLIVMSQTAFDNFTPEQKSVLAGFGELLPVSIETIETVGGGSARCMLGEVF